MVIYQGHLHMKRITVNIPDDCHFKLKVFASITQRPINDITYEAVSSYMKGHPDFIKHEIDKLKVEGDTDEDLDDLDVN